MFANVKRTHTMASTVYVTNHSPHTVYRERSPLSIFISTLAIKECFSYYHSCDHVLVMVFVFSSRRVQCNQNRVFTIYKDAHINHENKSFLYYYIIVLYCIVLYCIVLHCIALHCIALHCIALHCIALHCIALHCIALHCITLHYITLHYITLHYITLHYITLHYITLHYITLHYITLYITLSTVMCI